MKTELDEIWSGITEVSMYLMQEVTVEQKQGVQTLLSATACMYQYAKGLEFALAQLGQSLTVTK